MEECTFRLAGVDEKLIDADLAPGRAIAAIVERQTEFILSYGGWSRRLPEGVRFPMIRILDQSRVLVADSRADQCSKNAKVIDVGSGQETAFPAGDAIEEIVTFSDCVAVAYFDEAFGHEGLDGVVLFDLTGSRLWHDSFLDCYCACAQSPGHLLYLRYPGFELRQLDVATRRVREWQIPEALHGAAAMTSWGDTVFFHSPYDDPEGLLMWTLGAPQCQRFAEHPGRLRGLRGGRFLSTDEAECHELVVADHV